MSEQATVVQIAKQFHDAYERMAPFFGYSTQLDTREWSEASPNGQLMQATIREVVMPLIDAERQRADAAERKLEQAEEARPQTVAESERTTDKRWSPRFIAYARAHGERADAMLESDKARFPGGRLAGFSVWLDERWAEWRASQLIARDAVLSDDQVMAFDRWLQEISYNLAPALERASEPVPIIINCPKCHIQHIDVDDDTEKRAEELERMFGWITRRATEGRGLIAFCATEDGDVGLFRDLGDNDKSIGKGDDAEEAVLAAIANEEPRT